MLRTTLAENVETKGIGLYNLYGLSETLGEISAGTGQKGYEWQKPQDGVRFVLKEKGELDIINDKYAVKINEIISDEQNKQKAQPEPQAGAAQKPQGKPAAAPAAQNAQRPQQAQARPKPEEAPKDEVEEDFDYSDFEEEK